MKVVKWGVFFANCDSFSINCHLSYSWGVFLWSADSLHSGTLLHANAWMELLSLVMITIIQNIEYAWSPENRYLAKRWTTCTLYLFKLNDHDGWFASLPLPIFFNALPFMDIYNLISIELEWLSILFALCMWVVTRYSTDWHLVVTTC